MQIEVRSTEDLTYWSHWGPGWRWRRGRLCAACWPWWCSYQPWWPGPSPSAGWSCWPSLSASLPTSYSFMNKYTLTSIHTMTYKQVYLHKQTCMKSVESTCRTWTHSHVYKHTYITRSEILSRKSFIVRTASRGQFILSKHAVIWTHKCQYGHMRMNIFVLCIAIFKSS